MRACIITQTASRLLSVASLEITELHVSLSFVHTHHTTPVCTSTYRIVHSHAVAGLSLHGAVRGQVLRNRQRQSPSSTSGNVSNCRNKLHLLTSTLIFRSSAKAPAKRAQTTATVASL